MEKNMIFPVGIYLLKFNNRNTRTKCGICSELKITTPNQKDTRSGVFVVNFEHIAYLFLRFYYQH